MFEMICLLRRISSLKQLFLYLIVIFVSIQFFIMYSTKEISVLRAKAKVVLDYDFINYVAEHLNFSIYIIDQQFLSHKSFPHESYLFHTTILGIDAQYLEKVPLILNNEIMSRDDVIVEVLYNENPLMENHGFKLNSPIALILERNYAFILYILYSREDNTYWYGNLASDGQCYNKLQKFLIAKVNCNRSVLHENILNKFESTIFESYQKPLQHVLVPKDWANFIAQSSYSDFLECNYSRSELFKKTFNRGYTNNDLRFKHRAWKLLAKAKTILDFLSKPFWISSGTCLGYFRECDFIPYSKDVDIAMFSKDYGENIIKTMESHGLKLLHLFGLPNDSLELSFIDKGGIKLDIFFFYEEDGYFWNGGTQLKTGKKFKYIFPKFQLCWTLFMGLKVRIPCETEKYIVANYGRDWFTPIHEWDWKKSPHNVHPNGFWKPYFQKTRLLKEMFVRSIEEEGSSMTIGKVNFENVESHQGTCGLNFINHVVVSLKLYFIVSKF